MACQDDGDVHAASVVLIPNDARPGFHLRRPGGKFPDVPVTRGLPIGLRLCGSAYGQSHISGRSQERSSVRIVRWFLCKKKCPHRISRCGAVPALVLENGDRMSKSRGVIHYPIMLLGAGTLAAGPDEPDHPLWLDYR
jgi:hypothetical protein